MGLKHGKVSGPALGTVGFPFSEWHKQNINAEQEYLCGWVSSALRGEGGMSKLFGFALLSFAFYWRKFFDLWNFKWG